MHGAESIDVRRAHCLGTTADVILDYASTQEVDLVVMGTHGRRGIRQLLLGSVAQEVMRRADVPVIVVRALQNTAPVQVEGVKTVVTCIDFSDAATDTIRRAGSLAEVLGAKIELLHIIDPVLADDGDSDGMAMNRVMGVAKQEMERLYRESQVAAPLGKLSVLVGYPPFEITEYVRKSESGMVVLGRQGMSEHRVPSEGLTADYVVRAVPCPVVVVPASGKAQRKSKGLTELAEVV